MSFTRDGSLVVLTTAEIVVLAPETQLARPIVTPNVRAAVNSLAVSADGRSIAAADTSGRVRVWDIASGRLGQTINATTPIGIGAAAVAYQPGSGIIVVGSGDGTLTAWDPRTGQRLHAPIRLTKPSPLSASTFPGLGVFGVAFDARGRNLAAATGDGRVAVIDPTTWTVRRTIRLIDDAISFDLLAMSPDGRTVALGGPGKVAISGIDGGHRRELDVGPVAAASVAFQPGGRLLIAGLADGRILSIDATTAHLRSTLVSNHGGTFALTLDATGNTLATGGSDGTVTLWDVTEGQPLGPPLISSQRGTTLYALAFSTHSDSLYAGSIDGSLVRYQLQPLRWIDQLCAAIGRNLTLTERHAYLSEPTAGRQTCPNWPAASGPSPEARR